MRGHIALASQALSSTSEITGAASNGVMVSPVNMAATREVKKRCPPAAANGHQGLPSRPVSEPAAAGRYQPRLRTRPAPPLPPKEGHPRGPTVIHGQPAAHLTCGAASSSGRGHTFAWATSYRRQRRRWLKWDRRQLRLPERCLGR
jgi:hypothetical protein